MLLPWNHIALTSGMDVRKIIAPLAKYGIDYLDYFRLQKKEGIQRFGVDGKRVWLGSDPKVTQAVFQNASVSNVTEYHVDILKPENRYCLWKDVSRFVEKKYQKTILNSIFSSKVNFGIDHGITIFNDCIDFVEAFNFASTTAGEEIYHFYLNNLDILELFIHYFHDKARGLLCSSEKKHILLPRDLSTNSLRAATLTSPSELEPGLGPKRFYLYNTDPNAYFTKQEFNVLSLISKGYTIKYIAKYLGISPRTVESLLRNARVRVGVYQTADLIELFMLNNLQRI